MTSHTHAAEVDLPRYRLSASRSIPTKYGPKDPVLLAVDQKLGDGACRWFTIIAIGRDQQSGAAGVEPSSLDWKAVLCH